MTLIEKKRENTDRECELGPHVTNICRSHFPSNNLTVLIHAKTQGRGQAEAVEAASSVFPLT